MRSSSSAEPYSLAAYPNAAGSASLRSHATMMSIHSPSRYVCSPPQPTASHRRRKHLNTRVCSSEKGQQEPDESSSSLGALEALLSSPPTRAPAVAESGERQGDKQQEDKPQGGEGEDKQSKEGWYWWDRPAGPQTNPLRRGGMPVSAGTPGPRCTPSCCGCELSATGSLHASLHFTCTDCL